MGVHPGSFVGISWVVIWLTSILGLNLLRVKKAQLAVSGLKGLNLSMSFQKRRIIEIQRL